MDGGDGRPRPQPPALPLSVPLWTRDATLGMVVKHFAPAVLKRLEDDGDELGRLQTLAHSEAVFGLTYPFLQRAGTLPPNLESRYFIDEHPVHDLRYRVTSQWPPQLRARFLAYLVDARRASRPQPAEREASEMAEDSAPFAISARPATGVREHGPRDAEDAFVRHVLGGADLGAAGETAAARAVLGRAAEQLAALAERTAAELQALRSDAREDDPR